MSGPLWEEQHLEHCPEDDDLYQQYRRMCPLGVPDRSVLHQALRLDATEDVAIGQADNGMLWLWDLSVCLGWQRPQRQPSWGCWQAGLPTARQQAGGADTPSVPSGSGAWHHLWRRECSEGVDEAAPWRPQPLGHWPHDDHIGPGLCRVLSDNGRSWLIGRYASTAPLADNGTQSGDAIQCLALARGDSEPGCESE